MTLVKSKQRVADHGEVFTPAWMVEAMLDHECTSDLLDVFGKDSNLTASDELYSPAGQVLPAAAPP